jgi:2-iminobutanoate/2-iminopropanoate deaminase
MTVISTTKAPEAIGPYSQAIMVNDTLYVSGQTPLNPRTMTVEAKTIKEQTVQVLENIRNIVLEAGLDIEKIVKCGVFLSDMNNFKEMNQVYQEFFGEHKPARVTVEVSKLPLNALVEIDCIAVK